MTDTLRLVSVEDQQVDAELVADALAAAGLAVRLERVDDEAGFLRAIETAWPDAILCDWNLPRFSGRRALEIARDRCPEVPCIVVSGTIRDATVIEALHLGAADCIHKNQLELLAPALNIALEHTRRLRVMREQETMLREMSAMAHIGAWRFDPATGRGSWTEETTRIFGLPPETELVVALALGFFHGPSRERIEAAVRAASEPGKPFDLELEMVTAGGNRKWVRAMGIPVLQDGRVIAVRGSIQDITERKEAQQRLAESEEMFRSIFDGALDGILLADAETRKFLTGNPMICRMLGYTHEELTRLGVADIHPEQDLPHVVQQFERQLRGDTRLAADIPIRRKDGSAFYADIKSSPVQLRGKTYLLGIFRDITERKQAESRIAEQMEELRRWNEVTLGREMRSIELKHEVNELLAQAGQPPRYPSAEQDETTSPDIS